MKKLLFASILAALSCCVAFAQVPITGAGKGTPRSFQGIGDVQSGAYAYYSCAFAYNAAYATALGKACRVVKASDGSGGCDLLVSADGIVHSPSTQCSTECSVSCKVTTAYDQSGNTRDATQGTLASMPVLLQSALNSLPGLTCTNAGANLVTANQTAAQPLNGSVVFERTGNVTLSSGWIGTSSGVGAIIQSSNSANSARLNSNGSVVSAAASDSAYHALNGLFNGASSVIMIDGSETSGTVGANGLNTSPINLCTAGGGGSTGILMEGAFYQGSAFNTTQRNAININQHSRYNF